MSFDYNYKLWLSAKKDIKQLIKKQNLLKKAEPIEDPKASFNLLCQIYILYAELVDKLGYLYRQTVQVQKKEVINNLIQPVLKRFVELRNKLKELELGDHVYMDKFLIQRKMTPYDLLIWQSYFGYTRPLEVEAMLPELHRYEKKTVEEVVQAVIKIQSHERARKARLLKYELDNKIVTLGKNLGKKVSYVFSKKKDLFFLIPIRKTLFRPNFVKSSTECQNILDKENLKEVQFNDEEEVSEKLINSARIIQRAWKNYKAKRLLRMKLNEKQSLYGMRKAKKFLKLDEYERNNLEEHLLQLKQKKLHDDYLQLTIDERERLLEEHKPQIMEDISDHIRYWFREFYDNTGDFHPYPDANDSGTVRLLLDETMDVIEYQHNKTLSKEERRSQKEKLKLAKQREKDKKRQERLKQLKDQKKMREAGTIDIATDLKTNKNVQKIEEIFSNYSTDWKNVDEYLNKNYEAIKEWVTESELANIHKELRILVDTYMRTEYDLLKQAWCEDNKEKFTPTKTREKKEKKPTKVKRADSIFEPYYQALKEADIIDNYQVKLLEDYIGEFNFLADDSRNESNLVTSPPFKADVKVAIQDILFGMGAFDIEKPKSLCLVGPANNGKKLLCNIIASELGALFLNLSPEKTVRFADNLKYFIHAVMKVAKAFQPTIIFIEEAHRLFWTKVPEDQVDIQPTLLNNALTKNILKSIGKKHKIMVVGTSSLPWTGGGKFKKAFENILLVPESDYGTIYLMWLELLTQNANGNYDDSIFSVLAKIFQKYNTGDIVENVANSLNTERRMRLHSNPLQPDEFLEYFLSQSIPLFPQEQKVLDKFQQWYRKSSKFGEKRSLKELENKKKKK